MSCYGGGRDKFLYNQPLQNCCRPRRAPCCNPCVRPRCCPRPCPRPCPNPCDPCANPCDPCANSGPCTTYMYPAITERKTENGQEVVYFRIGCTSYDGTVAAGAEGTNEECLDGNEKPFPKPKESVKPKTPNDKKAEGSSEGSSEKSSGASSDSEGQGAKKSGAQDKKKTSKDAGTDPENKEEDPYTNWWCCGEDGCPCEDQGLDERKDYDGHCCHTIIYGKDGKPIRIPCHFCFPAPDANNNGGGGYGNGGGQNCCPPCQPSCPPPCGPCGGRRQSRYGKVNRVCCGSYSGGWNTLGDLVRCRAWNDPCCPPNPGCCPPCFQGINVRLEQGEPEQNQRGSQSQPQKAKNEPRMSMEE